MGSRSRIRDIKGFRGPSAWPTQNTEPNTKDVSSPTDYFKHFITEFLVTLSVEESDVRWQQCYTLPATSSVQPLGNTVGEMKVYFALVRYVGHNRRN